MTASERIREQVANASANKYLDLGGVLPTEADAYRFAAGRNTGAGARSTTQVEEDLSTLRTEQLIAKYGRRQAMHLLSINAAGQRNYDADTTQERTGSQIIGDAATGVGLAVGSGLANIGAIGLGLADSNAGVSASQAIQEASTAIQGMQSPGMQGQRRALAAANEMSERDNTQEFNRENQTLVPGLADLRRIGRDFRDQGSNIVSNPAMMGDLGASAVGSIITAGPVGKAIAGVGRGLGVITESLAGGAAARGLATIGESLPSATALGIGLTEGSGAYTGTAAEVAAMPFDQLNDRSPYYRSLLGQGMTQEEARTGAANRAGMMSATITAPLAVAAGRLVDRFEGAPFSVGSLRAAGQNMIREATEESIQGGTGAVAQNIAIQRVADSDRSLSQGVGEQIASGAIGGLAGAGAIQAPALAGRAAGAAGTVAAAGVSAVNAVAAERAERLRAQNEASSPVADATVRASLDEAQTQAPQTEAVVQAAVETAIAAVPDAPPEQRTQAQTYVSNLMQAASFSPEEVSQQPSSLQPILTGSTDRLDAMQRLAAEIKAASTDSERALPAAMALMEMRQKLTDAVMESPEILRSLDAEDPAMLLMQRRRELNRDISSTPTIVEAIAKAERHIERMFAQQEAGKTEMVQPIPVEKLNTPEGQDNVKKAVFLAHYAPERMDLGVTNQILAHNDGGRLELTPDQRNSLLAARAILEAVKGGDDQAAGLGFDKPLTAVSREIQLDTNPNSPKLSAMAHIKSVVDSMRQGNVDGASTQLREFGKFVRHMQNKAKAINQQVDEGGAPQMFRALDPEKREWYDTRAPIIHLKSANAAGSIKLAQTATLESQRLTDIYNNVSQAFPQLNAGKATRVEMSPLLQGTAQEVAEGFKSGTRVSGSAPVVQTEAKVETKTETKAPVEAKTETKSEAKPEPKKVEAKAETPKPAAVTETVVTPKAAEPATAAADTKTVETKTGAPKVSETTPKVSDGAPKVSEETAPKKEEPFSKLIGSETGSKLTNFYKKAFTKPEKPKSRTQGIESPLERVKAAFSSGSSMAAFTGNASDVSLDSDVAKAYKSVLRTGDRLGKILQGRLDAAMDKNGLGKDLLDGREVNRWLDGKALNIVENQDGKLSYNPELIENAILAGLQWALTVNQSITPMADEDIASFFGVDVDDITDKMVNQMKSGITSIQAKRALARKIRQFWGFDADANVEVGYTEGIPEAIAAEVLEALLENGQLKVTPVHAEFSKQKDNFVEGEDSVEFIVRDVNLYNSTREFDENDPLNKDPSRIEKMILIEPEEVNYFGDDRPRVAKSQLRNALVDNTPEQREMIKRAQNEKHYLNVPQFEFYKALGKDNFLKLLGAGDLPNRDKAGKPLHKLNVNHRATLEGINRTVAGGYDHLMGMVQELETRAGDAGVDIDQMPIHYAYNVTRVGRLMMLGRYNPQSTKAVREAILPTRATLDLSSRETEHYKMFMLAMAQGLGEKVHKQSLQTSIDNIEGKLSGDLEAAVDVMRDFQTTGRMTDAEVQILQDSFKAIGEPVTSLGLHALMEYARYRIADDTSAFTTSLYVEADGVTNGAINAMMLLSVGEFTKEWVNRMAKGGLNLRGHNGGPKTLNDLHTQKDGGDKKDMYQTTTDKLIDALRTLRGEKMSPQAAEHMRRLSEVMHLLMPDFSITQDANGRDQLNLKRGIAKNPLTITLYGSGEAGIAAKVMGAMTEELYERISTSMAKLDDGRAANVAEALFGDKATDTKSALQLFDQFQTGMNTLTQFEMLRSKDGNLYTKETKKAVPFKLSDPEDFKLTSAQLKTLQSNVLHLFIMPLRQAITETVGQQLVDATVTLRRATQVQSIFQANSFNSAISEKIHSKLTEDPRLKEMKISKDQVYSVLALDGLDNKELGVKLKELGLTFTQMAEIRRVRGEGLTKKEQDSILKDTITKFPLISTGTQVFFPAGSQSTDSNDSEYGKSLTGTFKTPGFVFGPKDARVAGIPFMVIGTGDGQAIQSLVTGKNAPKGALYIYDGVNFKLTTLKEDSVKANRAIFDSWQGNPMEAVRKAYVASLPNFDVSKLSEEEFKSLKRAIKRPGDKEPPETVKGVEVELKLLPITLKDSSISIEARHRVMNRVSHSIDQMAAAGAPYAHPGIKLEGMNDEEISNSLNKLLREEEIKVRAEMSDTVSTPAITKPAVKAETPAQVTQAPSPESQKPVTFGTLHKATGVRILSPTAVNKLVKHYGLNATQQAIFDQIRRTKAAKDYTVVHGSAEQLVDYADKKGLIIPVFKDGDRGLTSIDEKIIYLVNPSKETLVHELIHASTFEKVKAVLAGKDTTPEVVDAVTRLQALMAQFLALGGTGTPYKQAVFAIQGHQATKNDAAALNEFMAWGLANKTLSEGQSQVKASPLVQLAKDMFKAIKTIIFGRARVTKPEEDMLSNLLFNTSILVRAQPTLQEQARETMLYMSTAYGESQRLADIGRTFDRQISTHLETKTDAKSTIDRADRYDLAQQGAEQLAKSAIDNGFSMTGQERTIFETMVAVLATEAAIDPNAMATAQTLYTHVVKNLTPDMLVDEDDVDPGRAQNTAQRRYDVLVGNRLTLTDQSKRSSLLPVFLALAMVNDPLRQALAKIEVPKILLQDGSTLDSKLENMGNLMMDSLSRRMGGINKSDNIQEAMDALSARIQTVSQDGKSTIEMLSGPGGRIVDGTNDAVIKGMNALAGALVKKAEARRTKKPTLLNRGVAATTKVMAALVNEDEAENVSTGVMSGVNTVERFAPMREFVGDLVGRTTDNAGVYDLIKKVRSYVQAVRQQFREDLPTFIKNRFSRPLTEHEWSTLFRGMAKTDLAVLAQGRKVADVLKLLGDPKSVKAEIARLESVIRDEDKRFAPLIEAKARQLAHHMNTGEPGTNLLSNAGAVARLLNERVPRNRPAPTPALIDAVDNITTLYALEGMSQEDKDSLASLVQDEAKGVEFALTTLMSQRKTEMKKVESGRADLNHYKGHIPSSAKEGASLIVADVSRHAELLAKSYTMVGDYSGSNAELGRPRQAYYFSSVPARAGFNQGIFQNVHQTASGVEANTGFTSDMVAGRITDPKLVEDISKSLWSEAKGSRENLIPRFNVAGKVIAYERSLDPAQLERLEHDSHLAKMMGVWRGRQEEEGMAQAYNEQLIDELGKMYKKDMAESSSNQSRYVDLLDQDTLDKDPVLKDAVALMSRQTMKYAEEKFDGKGFYVRRDMLNDALGYRAASVGDAWTGITRLPPGLQNGVKNLALSFAGNDAYRLLLTAEKTIQNTVKDARLLIVVKSVVVPVANFVSNVVQMLSQGVPIGDITRAMPKKIAEVNSYTAGRLREVEAEAELSAAEAIDDVVTARKLKSEIQTIQDSHRRLSIWPLIENGEFSSISDAGISREDILLSEGRLHAYMENLAQKLPGSLQTVGRYALITKDTALFQGLQKAVEYGDFLAKSITYDHLTKRKGFSKEKTLGKVTENFVNYDRLPGRSRGAVENLGLLWFYNYKIRSVKIAANMIRENPVHAMLMGLMPMPVGVGTPIEDNLLTKGFNGALGHSMGPGMAFGAWRLNPFAAAVF
jgi:hypothetical protein